MYLFVSLILFIFQAELLGGKPKLPLLKDAVPTLFLHNNFKADVKRRVYSEERRKRKEKEEVNFFIVFGLTPVAPY